MNYNLLSIPSVNINLLRGIIFLGRRALLFSGINLSVNFFAFRIIWREKSPFERDFSENITHYVRNITAIGCKSQDNNTLYFIYFHLSGSLLCKRLRNPNIWQTQMSGILNKNYL